MVRKLLETNERSEQAMYIIEHNGTYNNEPEKTKIELKIGSDKVLAATVGTGTKENITIMVNRVVYEV